MLQHIPQYLDLLVQMDLYILAVKDKGPSRGGCTGVVVAREEKESHCSRTGLAELPGLRVRQSG